MRKTLSENTEFIFEYKSDLLMGQCGGWVEGFQRGVCTGRKVDAVSLICERSETIKMSDVAAEDFGKNIRGEHDTDAVRHSSNVDDGDARGGKDR